MVGNALERAIQASNGILVHTGMLLLFNPFMITKVDMVIVLSNGILVHTGMLLLFNPFMITKVDMVIVARWHGGAYTCTKMFLTF